MMYIITAIEARCYIPAAALPGEQHMHLCIAWLLACWLARCGALQAEALWVQTKS